MAHWRVKNPSLAVAERHDHRFVSFGDRRKCRCQHLHILRRATQLVIELIVGMHPRGRHPLCDWMLCIAHNQREGPLWAVVATSPCSSVTHQFSGVVVIDIRSALLVASTPATQADHLIEGNPIWK